MAAPALAWYITAHGYGHGVRSCDALRAVMEQRPDLRVIVVTDLPEAFLRNRLPSAAWTHRAGSFDSGMVQRDSVRVDLDASRAAALDVQRRRPALRARELAWLQREDVQLVVADVPGIPLEAARAAGLPAVAMGNFGWDWIYEEFAERDRRWAPAVQGFREAYAQAHLLLRLPFHEPMAAFPAVEDVPLLSRPGRADRAKLARLTGADPSRRWALLSFTTLGWDEAALRRVQVLRDWAFFTVKPLAWPGTGLYAVDRHDMGFADILASVDVVVTKPGYGILSECAVNRKPIVYVDREDFREYPVLEAAVKKHFRHRHIPAAELYAGELGPHLEAALAAPEPEEKVPAGGDQVVADRLCSRLSG